MHEKEFVGVEEYPAEGGKAMLVEVGQGFFGFLFLWRAAEGPGVSPVDLYSLWPWMVDEPSPKPCVNKAMRSKCFLFTVRKQRRERP